MTITIAGMKRALPNARVSRAVRFNIAAVVTPISATAIQQQRNQAGGTAPRMMTWASMMPMTNSPIRSGGRV